MRHPLLSFFVLCTLFLSINRAEAQTTYTWSGGTSGTWITPGNWQVGGVTQTVNYPGHLLTNDIAVINTSNATITYSGAQTIGSLQSTSFGVTGITLNFTGTTPTLTIGSGISLAQPSSASTVLTLSGNGTATVSGTSAFPFHASMAVAANFTLNFAASSTLDMTANQGSLANAGTINFAAGSTFSFGTMSSLVNSGTVAATSTTFNMSGSGTPGVVISNTGIFNAISCTFTLSGANTNIQNTGVSANFTSKSCTFNISNSGGTRISNTAVFRDHASTITFTGNTGCNITNSGNGNMYLSGTSITGDAASTTDGVNNSATFKADSASSITLSGFQDYVTNSGTFNAGTSGSACVITLGAQSTNVTNTGTFYLGSTSIIYPSGIGTAITNTSPGVFTLQSDAVGSAAIGPLYTATSPVATVTGTFNVERYFQGGAGTTAGRYIYRNYRIISSPVHSNAVVSGNNVFGLNYIVGATAGQTTAASSLSNVFITGASGGSTSAGNPSVYLYKESIVPSNATFTSGNFIGITDITNSSTTGAIGASDGGTYSLPIGTGVFFFFRGAATNWATRTVAPYITPDNVTLTSTGNINTGALTTKDWYNPTVPNLSYTVTGVGTGSNTNTAVRGFNLVGNPYPCSIDWNTAFSGTGITRTNINPTIYVFNPVTNQYDTYITTSASTGVSNGGGTDGAGNATNIIASGQGFFVMANNTSAALTFRETAKAPTSQVTGSSLLLGTPVEQNTVQQLLRLKLITDSLNYDNIAIAFSSTASANYNNNEDAIYLPGLGALEGLSSLSADGVNLAINFLPLPKLTAQVIKLDVEAAGSGTYSFQQTALTAIPQIYDIWLMDNYKKDSLDIRANTTYAFNINKADTTTFGRNRFSLVIRQNPALAMHLLEFNGTIVSSESQITWKTEFEQNYTNFTVERSTDNGATFNALGGFLSSAAGNYSFTDKSPVKGADQYRLKLVDLNGTVTYSSIITLEYSNLSNSLANNLTLYPNPANSVINLSVNQGGNAVNWSSTDLSAIQTINLTPSLNATANNTSAVSYDIKIINITGAVVKTATSTQPTWQGNVGNLPPGTYIIQVTNSSDKSVVGKNTFIKL